MTKIYDCCMVFEELDMLELRMHILAPLVDHFVIVESGMTHSGQPKGHPVGDALQTERFAPFAEQVIYHYVDSLPGGNAWERERAQRALIGDVLRYFAAPDDWIIVGDADEIASPTAVETLWDAAGWANTRAVKLELDFFYYDFQHRVREGWAIGACRWGVQPDANKIRQCDFGVDPLVFDHAGWHFSYFGNTAAIMRKAQAFMHFDWIDAYGLNEAKIQRALAQGVDLWGRSMKIDYLPHNPKLPRYVLEHRAQYEALGWLEKQTQGEATWQS